MSSNHLEQLVAEWYEFTGYFVRRNVKVGRRPKGGYECELDVVAFNPSTLSLVHLEPSTDSDRWDQREARYEKKFAAGRKFIPSLFEGLQLPPSIDQVALFIYGGRAGHATLAGGRVMLIAEFMAELLADLRHRPINKAAVPETFPLLRSLQLAAQFWPLQPPRL